MFSGPRPPPGVSTGKQASERITVTPEQWAAAKADLEAGKGTELASKFLAAYSSSALAVNAFAPLDGRVPLPDGTVVVGETRFERERSAWARGYKPALDVIVDRAGAPVRLLVESKCVEYLRPADTAFSPAFPAKAAEYLEPCAAAVFDEVFADRYAYDPLDAPQLLKHFLAAKRVTVEESCRTILLCVWWQPADAAAYPVFDAHAQAAARLAAALADANVTMLCATTSRCGRTGTTSATLCCANTSRTCARATTFRSRAERRAPRQSRRRSPGVFCRSL